MFAAGPKCIDTVYYDVTLVFYVYSLIIDSNFNGAWNACVVSIIEQAAISRAVKIAICHGIGSYPKT